MSLLASEHEAYVVHYSDGSVCQWCGAGLLEAFKNGLNTSLLMARIGLRFDVEFTFPEGLVSFGPWYWVEGRAMEAEPCTEGVLNGG